MKKIIFLFIIPILTYCKNHTASENILLKLQKQLPNSISGRKWNHFLNYIPYNPNSIYLIRENFLYGDFTIIEFTNFCEDGKRELRLYEIDLFTVNDQFQRRTQSIIGNKKSLLRNIQTFIFEIDKHNIPNFENLSRFQKNEFDSITSHINYVKSYIILDAKKQNLYWVNPNNGFDVNEIKIISWIEPIVTKISAQELLYFEYFKGKRNHWSNIISTNEIKKIYGDSFIIPVDDLNWNVETNRPDELLPEAHN